MVLVALMSGHLSRKSEESRALSSSVAPLTGKRLTPPGPRQLVPAIVLTNVGLLAALICGPNSTHPNVLAARLGIGVMLLGLVLLAGVALSRKPPRRVQR